MTHRVSNKPETAETAETGNIYSRMKRMTEEVLLCDAAAMRSTRLRVGGPGPLPRTQVILRARAQGKPSRSRSNVLIAPGFFNSSEQYLDMREALLSRGHPQVEIIQLKSWEWLLPTILGTSFKFYVDKMDKLAKKMVQKNKTQSSSSSSREEEEDLKLSLVAHSAGGWLARIWLGETGIFHCNACSVFFTNEKERRDDVT